MTISSSQIHNVLRTYGKQLRRGARLNRPPPVQPSPGEDQIRISPEAKRAYVVERVAAELIFRLATQEKPAQGVEKEVLSRLNQEYGEPLGLSYDPDRGRFTFHVVDADRGEILRTLDEAESEKLSQRLAEVASEIVNQTML